MTAHSSWWKRLAMFAFALLLVGCDVASKQLAETHLQGRPEVHLVDDVFGLTYTRNHDVGFSLLRAVPLGVRTPLIFTMSAVATVAILVLWLRRREAPWFEQLGYALVTAGALGNLIDRSVRGYVVDYFHLARWPVFNVADAFVCVGVAALLLARRKTAKPLRAADP